MRIAGRQFHIIPKRFHFKQVDRQTGEEVVAWDQWKVAPRILPFMRGYRKLLVISLILSVITSVVAPCARAAVSPENERMNSGLPPSTR